MKKMCISSLFSTSSFNTFYRSQTKNGKAIQVDLTIQIPTSSGTFFPGATLSHDYCSHQMTATRRWHTICRRRSFTKEVGLVTRGTMFQSWRYRWNQFYSSFLILILNQNNETHRYNYCNDESVTDISHEVAQLLGLHTAYILVYQLRTEGSQVRASFFIVSDSEQFLVLGHGDASNTRSIRASR